VTPVLALQPHPYRRVIVLVIAGSITRDEVARLVRQSGKLLRSCVPGRVLCDVSAVVDPDAATVDVLARLQLAAKRLGQELVLRPVPPELRELLALVGLDEVIPLVA
jgi:ABC-type transporter Mla MlaB component